MRGGYRDLKVWQTAADLAEVILLETSSALHPAGAGLAETMRRAAVAVPSNIAAGHHFGHGQGGGDSLAAARHALLELETHVILASRIGLLGAGLSADLLERCDHVGRMLTRLRQRSAAPSARSRPLSRASRTSRSPEEIPHSRESRTPFDPSDRPAARAVLAPPVSSATPHLRAR